MNTMNSGGKVPRQIMLVVLGAALILSVPLLAMQFTDEVALSPFDFALAGVLLVGIGVAYVLAARVVRNTRYRLIVGCALAAALLVVWVELAVGVFGSPFAGT